MFNKGDIVFYFGKNGRDKDRAKSGAHLWVILHSYTHPLNTILMVPITSKQGYENTSVKLSKDEYPDVLEHDSYLDFRSICVANTENIKKAKGLDSNGKNKVTLPSSPRLTEVDIFRSDLAAMQALEIGQTVKALVEKQVKKQSEQLVDDYKSDLTKEFSHVMRNITNELDKMKNESVKNLILAILNNFKEAMK